MAKTRKSNKKHKGPNTAISRKYGVGAGRPKKLTGIRKQIRKFTSQPWYERLEKRTRKYSNMPLRKRMNPKNLPFLGGPRE